MTKVGYGQLELNQVAFPRDGRIEAQLPLDKEAFGRAGQAKRTTGTHAADTPCEVGMILAVEKAAGYVTTADNASANAVYALNYSTEHMYDERTPQLRNFCMYPADNAPGAYYDMTRYDDFYPRLGYLAVGDRFTTNTIEDDFADLVVGTTVLRAGDNGYWDSAATVGPKALVVEKTTMPDGQDAAKLMIIEA